MNEKLIVVLAGAGTVMACLLVLALAWYAGSRLKGYVAEVTALDVSASFEADEDAA